MKDQRIKAITFHPLGTMNICSKFHNNPLVVEIFFFLKHKMSGGVTEEKLR